MTVTTSACGCSTHRFSRETSRSARESGRAGTSTSTASRPIPSSCASSASGWPGRRPRPSPTPSGLRARCSEPSCWPLRQRWRPDGPSSSCAMKPRDTAPGTASRGRTSRGSSCASSRTSSRRAAPSARRWTPFAKPGLVVHHAVCVVDREEGGADALARLGVRLASLYRAGDLLATREHLVNRMVEPNPPGL